MQILSDRTKKYDELYGGRTAEDLLREFLREYKGSIVLATSFGAEDQVLTHMVVSIDPDTEIFTLDTGRVPEETYTVWERTERFYGIKIRPFFPDRTEVERLVADQGINGFYESIEKRKRCCRVRKIEPLRRALENRDVWITGLRREQSVTSIGCAPCTRAVKEGEDIRGGRWWWESPEHKECGLHLKKERRV